MYTSIEEWQSFNRILPDRDDEAVDAVKKFTNIDTEKFSFTWDGKPYRVKPGQTTDYPKYLVNYASRHLAKKIVKREAFAKAEELGKSPNDQLGVAVPIRNPKREYELVKQMVAANFATVAEKSEATEESSAEGLTCEECGFEAKNIAGLKAHLRSHK